MTGLGNSDERGSANAVVELFTHSQREHPIVFTPDDHGWVRDAAEVWGEIGFPGREGIPDGHDGLDDAGASAVLVGPFDDGRGEEGVVVDDFFQDGIGDQPTEQPVAEGDEPGRGSRFQSLPERPAGELGHDLRRESADEHELIDTGGVGQGHANGQPCAHGIAD